MFQYFYFTTKDEKSREHRYKLVAGEAVPIGHDIIAMSLAHYSTVTAHLSDETVQLLKAMFPSKRKYNATTK